jgi:hypothetical protein
MLPTHFRPFHWHPSAKHRSPNRRQAGSLTKWRLRPLVERLEDRALFATHFLIAGFPAVATAGVVENITVTALNSDGSTDTTYWSPFHFRSSDPWAVLPETSFLTNGTGTFQVTLQTAGKQSITATDASNSTITGSQSGVLVRAAATSQFFVSGLASPATAGVAGKVTVTAEDAFGNPTPGYTGTVHFTSSDAQALLPADQTLTNGTGMARTSAKSSAAVSPGATRTRPSPTTWLSRC